MKYDADYAEAGADYYDQRDARNREHLVRHHQQALARLGYHVSVIPPGDARSRSRTNCPRLRRPMPTG